MSANAESVLAKTQVEDDQQTHVLTERKLISSDERIASILNKCINKIEIISTLDSVLQSNRLFSVEDETLSRALKEHRKLALRLDMQGGVRQKSDGKQSGKGKETSSARAQLETDIKYSVRELLRHIQKYPDAILGLRAELGFEIGVSECLLISELKNTQGNLQSSMEEDPELAHEKRMSLFYIANMVPLREEVKETLTELDEQISEKNHQIKDLKSSLEDKVNEEAQLSPIPERLRRSNVKSEKQISIEQKIDDLNNQLPELFLENGRAKREQEETNEKVEGEIVNLVQDFDEKMEEIQPKLELNEMEYGRQEEELRELQTPYSVLEMESQQIYDRRELEEKELERKVQHFRMTKAAILIQSRWRAYRAGKTKSKGKKGKKDKGKGKKGKKGGSKKAKKG